MNTALSPKQTQWTGSVLLGGLRPFCNVCGWRKGGPDSWNGRACKCGLTERPLADTEMENAIREGVSQSIAARAADMTALSPKQDAEPPVWGDKDHAMLCLNSLVALLGGDNGPTIQLRSFIAALPNAAQSVTVANDRRWIPVTTRLPAYNEDAKVLAYTHGHSYGGDFFHHIKALDFYEFDPDGDGEPGTELARNVTHWMPEPYPPGDEMDAAKAVQP